jgi:hypothetical protein
MTYVSVAVLVVLVPILLGFIGAVLLFLGYLGFLFAVKVLEALTGVRWV